MTGIDERVSLSQKPTLTLLRFRTTTVSSLLLLSTDIRKIQNKSGEPETVENTRWRIMIRCDEAFVFPLEGKKKRERDSKSVHFFFSPFIIDSISDAESDRANENERLPRAHTDRVFFLSVRLTFFFSTTTQRWRAVFASHGLAKIESFD